MITLVGSLKGGTGKSTVNFNLAVWLALEEEYEPNLSVKQEFNKLKRKKDTQVLVDVGTSDMETLEKSIKKADRIVIPVPQTAGNVCLYQSR